VRRDAGRRGDRVAIAAAWLAAALGAGSAAVSAYWAVGGTALLDTVGGTFERWGRERPAGAVLALVAIAVLKLVVAVAAPVLARAVPAPAWATGRMPRSLGWIAAVVLTLYGGALTAAGVLVEAGVIDPTNDGDRHALAWHTWFWDPWFFLWGVAVVVALRRTRDPAATTAPNVGT
jgi:hypothetical protein